MSLQEDDIEKIAQRVVDILYDNLQELKFNTLDISARVSEINREVQEARRETSALKSVLYSIKEIRRY